MVTKRADQVSDIVSKCNQMMDQISIRLHTLDQERKQVKDQLDWVERLGWVEAKPYYRDGKFLYLIYPMVNGERKREYIGSDPEKIEDALAKIERKEEYERLAGKLADIDARISRIRSNIITALGACGEW